MVNSSESISSFNFLSGYRKKIRFLSGFRSEQIFHQIFGRDFVTVEILVGSPKYWLGHDPTAYFFVGSFVGSDPTGHVRQGALISHIYEASRPSAPVHFINFTGDITLECFTGNRNISPRINEKNKFSRVQNRPGLLGNDRGSPLA